MPISRAQTPTKYSAAALKIGRGAVLAEIILVVFIIALFVSIALVNVSTVLGTSSFKAQANELVDSLQLAVNKAAQNGKRYEIIIDISNQAFIFREISSGNLDEVLQEEIIKNQPFSRDIRVKYVKFDDSQNTSVADGIACFRAGRAGFQAGGKIVLIDSSGKEYSIVVNRISRQISLADGDVEFLQPQDDVPF